MNYYLDTEFNEDFTKPIIGRSRHFIDLISIALVAEDNRQYYAVSKDFDLKAAWNKHNLLNPLEMGDEPEKEYWLRQNVLRPLHAELYSRISGGMKFQFDYLAKFTYKNLKVLISMYGKTNKEIAAEIQLFTAEIKDAHRYLGASKDLFINAEKRNRENPPTFYAYYADYDWVVFCSLFGKMIDLPGGYPMYCWDLKQMIDERDLPSDWKNYISGNPNMHLAISDAQWNQKVHRYLVQWNQYKNSPITKSH